MNGHTFDFRTAEIASLLANKHIHLDDKVDTHADQISPPDDGVSKKVDAVLDSREELALGELNHIRLKFYLFTYGTSTFRVVPLPYKI